MGIEADIRTHLVANGGLNALVGGKVWQDRSKRGAKRPYLVYTVASADPQNHALGESDLGRIDVQIGCFADDPAARNALVEAVRHAISGYSGQMGGTLKATAHYTGRRDEDQVLPEDPDRSVYAGMMDFDISYSQAAPAL